jgi:CDP-glycerol glycerophosphotransferase (TagB/SpsB family)
MALFLKKILFMLFQPCWWLIDALLPKRANYWAFCTHHIHTERFIENQRALFEHIKSDRSIKKVIFYRGVPNNFQLEDAVNFEIVKHGSCRGLWLLARCKVVFLTHSISMDFSLRWGGRSFSVLKLAQRQRIVVNLWHGTPIKRLLYTTNEKTRRHTDRVAYRRYERTRYAGLLASSDIDSYAMAAMFYPLNYGQIWLTGLPRNDFLLMPEEKLPTYIRESAASVRLLKGDKRLILYAPTYRQTEVSSGAYYYQFSDSEINILRDLLKKNNAILGFRPHYFQNSKEKFNLDKYIDGVTILDLSINIAPEISAVLRECDIVISDYSSVLVDALYLQKINLCFAYDFEEYFTNQDGLLYDLSLLFGDGVCRDFPSLLTQLESALSFNFNQNIDAASKIFFRHKDSLNCSRVNNRIRQSLGWPLVS